MIKTEKEIVEEIFNKYDKLTIKEWIVEGVKAGRKQLAEEKEKRILYDWKEAVEK